MIRALLCILIALPLLVNECEARIPPKSKRGSRDMLLVAGGDVAYPRGWMDRLVERQKAKMFDEVRPYANAAELAFVNLESPYTDKPFTLKKKWPIATPPHRLDYVLSGGFNLFSLANNHMGDVGGPGIDDTLELLRQKKEKNKNLFWVGAAESSRKAYDPLLFKVPGKKLTVAFHAFGYAGNNRVGAPASNKALEAIRRHADKADITIVSAHWGKEYIHVPKAGKAGLYRKYIDAGADVVLGHHPHVIQGVEAYKDGIIFHSLGNFSFASKTTRHHKTGAKLYGILPLIYFKNGKLERAEVLPLYVNNAESMVVDGKKLPPTNFKPQVLKGAFARQVLTELAQWTAEIPGIHARAVKAFEIKDDDRAWIQVRR